MRPVVVVVGNVDGDNLTTIGPAGHHTEFSDAGPLKTSSH